MGSATRWRYIDPVRTDGSIQLFSAEGGERKASASGNEFDDSEALA